jgi:hypothetical protein
MVGALAAPAWSVCISGSVGSALGLVVSWIVNSVLLEVSTSPLFTFWFAFVLLGTGALLARRALLEPGGPRPAGVLFALLVIGGGLLCLVVGDNPLRLSSASRVPLFAWLGAAVSSLLCLSLVDMVNLSIGSLRGGAVVESAGQVSSVVFLSVVMGLAFGLVFGVADVEDGELAFVCEMRSARALTRLASPRLASLASPRLAWSALPLSACCDSCQRAGSAAA